MEWKFIPKKAPWFGGFWERLIALTKNCLKKVLGRTHITLATLQTMVVEIEAVLNDRPLTYISEDSQDSQPLTPSHLLYGRRITRLPYEHVADIHDISDISKRARTLAHLLEHFRNRWKREYLTSLREFHKASGNNLQQIKVGDVVLIHNDGPRVQWKLAVVENLHEGADGLIRAADLHTSSGKTNRPIVPLEVTADEREPVKDTVVTEHDKIDDPIDRPPKRISATKAARQISEWTKIIHAPPPPPEDVEN